jgi:imidazolonepropionase-like amidohydrolase
MTKFGLALALLASPLVRGEDVRAIVGARIIDGTGKPAIEDGTLVIRDGRIVSVGPSAKVKPPRDAEVVNAGGKTIIPGLINAHGHVGETQGMRTGPQFYTAENVKKQLELYARYGITTVFSLGGDQEPSFRLRDEQFSGAPIHRSRIFVAGKIIVADTPEDARQQVDEVAATKPDIIKIRVDDNLGTTKKMTPPVYTAVIEEAHKKGLRVAVHVFYMDDAKAVLKLGADYIAHSVRDHDIDDEFIALMKKRDVPLCPTLTREVSAFAYGGVPEFFADPFFTREAENQDIAKQLQEPARQKAMHDSESARRYRAGLEIAKRNLKKLSDSGIRIVMGTDTGPPARFQGYFEHMELEMMVDAGLTPMQALLAATTNPTHLLKMDGKLGTLQPGAWADFLVLAKNPLENIRNTKSLESVWIGGSKL